MIDLTTAVTAILLVFYLYLLVRWQHVKRPWLYLCGAAGIALALFGRFFGAGTVMRIFNTLGVLIAFAGAVGASYGAELPVYDAMLSPKKAEDAAPQVIGPAPQQGGAAPKA